MSSYIENLDFSWEHAGVFLHRQLSLVWGKQLKVCTQQHPYSQKVRFNLYPERINGHPGVDYPILKLVLDLKLKNIQIRLLELPEELPYDAMTLRVIDDFARCLGDWQVTSSVVLPYEL